MDNNKQIYDIADAFLALNEIDDEEVFGMLKDDRSLNEGREYNLMAGQGELDDARDFINNDKTEASIEVIDVDANTEEHLKNKEDYVGQAILRCRRCMANRFINLEDLEADENDPDVYNVEDECPHCHISSEGYELIGQVGKVEEKEPEPEESEDEEEVKASEPEEEGEDEEEPKFDNDEESEEEAEFELPEIGGEEEEESEDEDFKEEEDDGMETYTSEDDDEEDEDEDKKKKKEESLGEALNENDADFHDHVARIFSNRVWAVNQALDLKGLQFLSRGNNKNWNIEDPDLFANGQRVYVLMDKTNREKYLARLNTDGELVTVDERGKNVPDIEYFGGPDVRELIAEDVEEVVHTEQGHEAYLMNEVISGMNDKGAYYESGWLYDWSDGTDEEDVEDYFGSKDPENEEAFNDLKDAYLRIYKHYHNGGLYNCRPEVVDYAHKTDAELGLSPIENLIPNKPQVKESLEVNELADVFNSIVDPDKIKVVEFHDVSKDGKRKLYEGAFDDAPFGLGGCPCKGFDTANHNLICTIDSEGDEELNPNTLAGALNNFSDDNTDKIHVWDDASGDEVFKGNKKDAIAKFGDKSFVAFDAPKVLRVYILAPHVIGTDDEEETEGEQKLVNDIIKANDLSTYKLDDKYTNEYWIKQSIHEGEDLDYIYETYIKPTKNDKLREEFTKVTGYHNELDEAYLAGLVEGKESEQPNVEASMAKMTKLAKSEIVKLENDLKKLEATAKKNNPDVEKQKAVLKDIEDQKARIKKWKSFIGESVGARDQKNLKAMHENVEEKTKVNNDGTVAVIAGPNKGIVVSNRCASVGKPFTVYAQSLETLEEFEIELPITIQDVADYLAYIATEPYTQDEVDEDDIIAEVVADKQIAYDEFKDIFEDNHADEIDVQVEQLEDESKEGGNYLTPQEDEWENDRIEEYYTEPNYGYDAENVEEPKEKPKFTRHRAKKIPFADLWEQVYASLTDSADNDEYTALGDLCGRGHYDVYSVRSEQDIKPGYDGITVVDTSKEDLHNRPTVDYEDENTQAEIEAKKAKFDNFEWAKHIAEVYGLESELSEDGAEFTIFVPIREIPRADLLNAVADYKEAGIIKEDYAYSLIEIATPTHLKKYIDGTKWNVTKDKWNKWAGENALLYVLLNRKDPEEKFLIVSWPEEDDVIVYDKDNKMQAPGDVIEHTTNKRLQNVMANWLTELGIISYHPEDIIDSEYRAAEKKRKDAEKEALRIRAQEKHKAKVAAQKAAKEVEEQPNESLKEDANDFSVRPIENYENMRRIGRGTKWYVANDDTYWNAYIENDYEFYLVSNGNTKYLVGVKDDIVDARDVDDNEIDINKIVPGYFDKKVKNETFFRDVMTKNLLMKISQIYSINEDISDLPVEILPIEQVKDFIINVPVATATRPPRFFKVGYANDLIGKVASRYKKATSEERVKVYKCSEALVYTGADYEDLGATKIMRKAGKERGSNVSGFNYEGEDCVPNKIGHYRAGGDLFLRAYLKNGTYPKTKYFISINDEPLRETNKQEVAQYFTPSAATLLLNGREEPENPDLKGQRVSSYALKKIYLIGNLGHSIF